MMKYHTWNYHFCRRKQRAARLQDSQRQELIDRAEPEEEEGGGHGGGHDELPMGEVMMYQVFISTIAQGRRGHWAFYYTGTQSIIIPLSNSLVQNLLGTFFEF